MTVAGASALVNRLTLRII